MSAPSLLRESAGQVLSGNAIPCCLPAHTLCTGPRICISVNPLVRNSRVASVQCRREPRGSVLCRGYISVEWEVLAEYE